MSYPVINKWFFSSLGKEVYNLHYLKEIPFTCFSDLPQNNYEVIGKILDRINLNRELLVSIGEKKAPFGLTINPTGEDLNKFLNSCEYAFVMTDKIEDTHYLLKTVLARVMPVCHLNHLYIKKLGLESFATLPDFHNILDKLCQIKYYKYIYKYRINLLAWKYNLQLKKWHKKK